jgi:hypothetical protein
MRLAVALALLATGCSVPEVSFYPDDAAGNPEGASSDAGAMDALDASEGSIGPSDAPYDGPDYCAPDGPAAPAGTKCCDPDAAAGVLCSGNCGAAACSMCVGCALPNICCTKAGHGTCEVQCQ